jgi:hypothetical protein
VEIEKLEAGLSEDIETRAASIFSLNKLLTDLSAKSRESADSGERRLARRVLSGVQAGSRGIPDPEFQDLLTRVRLPQ